MPSKKFTNINCLIGSNRIDNGLVNDIEAYMTLKDKTIHNDEFLINYSNFKDNYRIYSFNIDRKIRDNSLNKFVNITYQAVSINDDDTATVYAVYQSYATITLQYSENGLIVYKNY